MRNECVWLQLSPYCQEYFRCIMVHAPKKLDWPKVGFGVSYIPFIQMCFARLQILLGLVQFGFVVTYLSEPLVRGYTTGAAIHVIVSQLKYTFGINPGRFNGPLALIYVRRNYVERILDCMQLRFIVDWQFCKSNTWRHWQSQLLFFSPRHFLQTVLDICHLLPKTNIGTLVVSIVTIVCLIIAKEINAYLSKKIPVPIPVELLAVSTTHTRGQDQTCTSSSRPNCCFRRLLLPQSFRGRLIWMGITKWMWWERFPQGEATQQNHSSSLNASETLTDG